MTFNNNPTANAWTPEQDALLRQHFGIMDDQALADLLQRPLSSLAGRASRIRLTKTENRRKANPESAHLHRAARPKPGNGLQDIMATATPYGPAPIPAMGSTAKAIICNSVMRGAPYTCPELRPFDGRPGAMDAFALPSRRFDRRVYRDGRVEGVA